MKSRWMFTTMLAAALSMAAAGIAQVPAPKTTDSVKSTAKKTVGAAPVPTDTEIADAKAKGMVWANTSTKVYHKDGAFYGKTKQGKFMTEDEATKAGFRAAKEPVGKKARTDVKK